MEALIVQMKLFEYPEKICKKKRPVNYGEVITGLQIG